MAQPADEPSCGEDGVALRRDVRWQSSSGCFGAKNISGLICFRFISCFAVTRSRSNFDDGVLIVTTGFRKSRGALFSRPRCFQYVSEVIRHEILGRLSSSLSPSSRDTN